MLSIIFNKVFPQQLLSTGQHNVFVSTKAIINFYIQLFKALQRKAVLVFLVLGRVHRLK